MGKSKKLADATEAKRALHAEMLATGYSLGHLLPQFIDDNDDLDALIGYIANFRRDIGFEKPSPESLAVIDGMLRALREVLPAQVTDSAPPSN